MNSSQYLIKNPKTGRWVKSDGAIGKKILKQNAEIKEINEKLRDEKAAQDLLNLYDL